jgi:WD40 repeat protein
MLRFAFKPRHPITRVAFTADGSEVVTAQPFTGIAVRDRFTGAARWTVPMPKATRMFRLVVHPTSGQVVVCSTGGRIRLEPQNGERESSRAIAPLVSTDFGQVNHLDMWRGGTTHGETVVLELSDTDRPEVSCGNRSARLNSTFRWRHFWRNGVIDFSPDGHRLALGNGESLRVFDLSPLDATPIPSRARTVFQPILTLERPDPTQHGTFADKHAEQWLPPVAFDHAGRTMLTLGLRNRVQRIDLATGGVMAEWGWRCEPIRSLAVSPDDLTAAAGCQRGELVLWDLE